MIMHENVAAGIHFCRQYNTHFSSTIMLFSIGADDCHRLYASRAVCVCICIFTKYNDFFK